MIQVFISYSRIDLEFVRRLAKDLQDADLDVWWDLSGIQGSDVWEKRIEEGLRSSQYFIVVLTPDSLESRWVRREYLSADNAGVKIIPLKLKPYDVTPLTLRDIQPIDANTRPYEDVLEDVLGIVKEDDAKAEKKAVPTSAASIPEKESRNKFVELLLAKGTRGVDVGGTIPLAIFFLMAGIDLLLPDDDAVDILLIASAVLAGILFLLRKTIPDGGLFRISGIMYLLLNGTVIFSDYYGLGIPLISTLAGIAALASVGALLITIQRPKKPIYIGSFSFALVLFFIAANMYSYYVENYDVLFDIPIMITSVVTAILLWRDL